MRIVVEGDTLHVSVVERGEGEVFAVVRPPQRYFFAQNLLFVKPISDTVDDVVILSRPRCCNLDSISVDVFRFRTVVDVVLVDEDLQSKGPET